MRARGPQHTDENSRSGRWYNMRRLQPLAARSALGVSMSRSLLMTLDRRTFVAGSLALGATALHPLAQAAGTVLKISHQFPGGTLTEGDFRDRMCRRFAADIEKKTNGALTAQVYPNSSLMKTNAQFSAIRKGALDLSLVPLSYGGGEVPEVNIGLMPGLVTSYEQGLGWK